MNVSCSHASTVFFVGMAGSGKTSLIYRLSKKLSYLKKDHFIMDTVLNTRVNLMKKFYEIKFNF